MLCPRCQINPAIDSPSYGIMPCRGCQSDQPSLGDRKARRFVPVSRLHRIQQQQDQFGRDLIQPYVRDQVNPDFVRAYPEVAAENFTPQQLKESDV